MDCMTKMKHQKAKKNAFFSDISFVVTTFSYHMNPGRVHIIIGMARMSSVSNV